MWLRTVPSPHVGGSRDLAVVEALRDERHDLALAIRELRKERREVGSRHRSPAPRATARSSTSPSSTLRPAMTARSAGATPATSCLMR